MEVLAILDQILDFIYLCVLCQAEYLVISSLTCFPPFILSEVMQSC